MIFSEQQIQELIETIDFSHIFFIAGNIGTEILTESDKAILKYHGIDWKSISTRFTPVEQLYYFGRLASVLGPLQAQKVTFNDLQKYLRQGQFIPLSPSERQTLRYLQQSSANHVKELGNKIKTYITNEVEIENLAKERYFQEVVHDSLKRTVLERDTVSSIVSEIGERTGQWERDLGRIAQTQLQNAYEYGKGASFHDIYGNERIYYKEVYPGACKYCIKLYTTAGIGSEPRLFTYQELLDNGTNIGRKADDWLAVLGTVHPYCRCDLRVKRGDLDVWDEDQGIYVPRKREKSKGDIKIQVGDKEFIV